MDEHRTAEYREILNCLEQPAFLIKDDAVVLCNDQAAEMEAAIIELLRGGEFPDTIVSGEKPFHLEERPIAGFRLLLATPLGAQQTVLAAAARAIRTPLSNLFSLAATLLPYLEEQEDPRIQRQTAEINRSLYQLFRTVGNMEAVSSPPVGVHRERADLRAFLEDLCQRAQPLCEIAGLELAVVLPNTPIAAYLDRQRLERAVLNLLSNAIRFADPGSIVTIRLEPLQHGAVIRVSNLGEPVDMPGNLFCRSEKEPGNPKFGAGLGLTIVQEIAREHGGTVVFRAMEHGFTADLSLSLEVPSPRELRSPLLHYDYTGGFDHLLVELSDALPSSIYNSVYID
ncbi:MAG: HAMP domain-containing sensor histidine kinase [Oscillospiraceae bacterium]|nr:HAMP domain-containing sensor histidine kinase [Oscillospiraceae bacterium]